MNRKDHFEVNGFFDMWGEYFSPQAIEDATGIKFDRKKERGEIGDYGKFKGRPVPYGNASLFIDTNLDNTADLISPNDPKMEIIWRNMKTLRENGVTDIYLYIYVLYETQCNIELSPILLRKLADLSIPVCISCDKQ